MPRGVYWRPERMPRRPAIERFEEKAIPEPNSGCWLWSAYTDRLGYGLFSLNGKNGIEKAHRSSWVLYRGRIPFGMHVLHKCDVRCCVNPDHLFLGTHKENMEDKKKKGRCNNGRNDATRKMALEVLT